jgi:hypothetical protein
MRITPVRAKNEKRNGPRCARIRYRVRIFIRADRDLPVVRAAE